ncbi:MAG: 2-oxoacid:ferredoxin oxidoreductase subunit beta, partial [Candidatus Latescibacterota bacterium]
MGAEYVYSHIDDDFIRKDRMPHIWCPGCGIGIVLKAFIEAIKKAKIDPKKVVVVSGIGCTGRASGYWGYDGFHTTHGRSVPFALGLKLARPDLHVVVFSGDGDLFAIGGNHFIHAARRNADLLIICVNNFNYGMTGGQVAPTTPEKSRTTTTPFGNFEPPFNLVWLAAASGAVYVARWTTYHVRRLVQSIEKALRKRGLRFIEVISQCPTDFGRRNRMADPVLWMEYFAKHSVIRDNLDPHEAVLEWGPNGKIVVGDFV